MERSFEYTVFDSASFLPPEQQKLLEAATSAMDTSYSPYSRYRVGAAVRLKSGLIVTGSNQENASYGLTECAERTALFSVGVQGHKNEVREIAIMARGENHEPTEKVAQSCGACRQVMKEYEDLSGEETTILTSSPGSPIYSIKGVDSILPFSFGPKDLGVDIPQN